MRRENKQSEENHISEGQWAWCCTKYPSFDTEQGPFQKSLHCTSVKLGINSLVLFDKENDLQLVISSSSHLTREDLKKVSPSVRRPQNLAKTRPGAWLMPVIPAVEEAETDHLRLGVWDQPGQHDETLSPLKTQKVSRVWWHMPVIPATQGGWGRRIPWTQERDGSYSELKLHHFTPAWVTYLKKKIEKI